MRHGGLRSRDLRRIVWIVAVLMGAGWIASSAVAQQDEETAAIQQAKSLSRAFRSAAEKALPTVVKIKTNTRARTVERGSGDEDPFEGTPFEDLFKREYGGIPYRVPPRSGVGSGVIIDANGLVLTNNHVVEGADEVTVELSDGRQYPGTEIKVDPQTDLAVLRIKADHPLPAARLGDSKQLEIGDWVIAIGSPFELDQTVSAGIISGKGRELGAVRRANLLQTDAAINPGNSGGPLVNLDGEVVGINVAIASNNGGYQGIGFAIPVNVAKWVVPQLVEKGSVQRAYLGIGIGALTPEVADRLGVAYQPGVLVTEVFAGSPAEKAGFEPADVILTFSGHPVASPRQLQETVERSSAGKPQKVQILREGKPKTLDVVVRPMPTDFGLITPSPKRTTPGEPTAPVSTDKLGMQVSELSKEVAQRLGYEGSSGVVISEVEPDGLAATAGLRPGMLIMRVGNTAVGSVLEFEAAMKQESLEKGILFLVRSASGNRFVVLKAAS